MMELRVDRFFFGDLDTIGRFYIEPSHTQSCYTLEDERRDEKVAGETCIPTGRYRISLLTRGKHHDEYTRKFGDEFHKGMLLLNDVPGFKGILIHIGNTKGDAMGCLLVGMEVCIMGMDKVNRIDKSIIAYKKIYPKIRDVLLRGEDVWITVNEVEKK